VTDHNGLDYTIECEFEEVPEIIEYDPKSLPFMHEDYIDMLFPRTYEYKDKIARF
jgi:hypothetical protein